MKTTGREVMLLQWPYLNPIVRINVGTMYFTFLYVATSRFFMFSYQLYVVTTLCLRSGQVKAQNH